MTNTKSNIELMDKFCAVSKAPIRINGLSPFAPVCVPLGPDRAEFLNDRWPTDKFTANHKALRDGLLAFGGHSALIPVLDEDLIHLIERGQLWGATSKMMKGSQSQCHTNSALCWEANSDKLFLATGYALSDDGLWRQHTWCVHPRARSINIVETTERRELYFGYVLTLDETLEFGTNNTDMGIDADENTEKRYQFGSEKPAESESESESESKSESGKNTRSRRCP